MSSAHQPSVRDANLADVLSLVHLEGPLSRAALTRRTGLNRSTVGALVATLSEAGLVVERDPRPSQRVGRPSPVVVADSRVVVVAANPEVDALTIAAVGLGRRILARVRQDHDGPPTPDETAGRVAAQIARWRSGPLRSARVVGVGLAVPGLVRASDGLVRTAPHLGWTDVDLRAAVVTATGLPTVIGNDADLGIVAEHRFGAARGADDVVYLNGGGGGIGGAIIAGGVLQGGVDGYAGEFGHARIAPGVTLEDEVNRSRLLHAMGVHAADDAVLGAALRGAPPGSPVAEERERQISVLTTALADIVGALSPSIVVVGGFLADIVPDDLAAFEEAVRSQALPAVPRHTLVRRAELVENRLLSGAAEAIFDDQVLAAHTVQRWSAGPASGTE